MRSEHPKCPSCGEGIMKYHRKDKYADCTVCDYSIDLETPKNEIDYE